MISERANDGIERSRGAVVQALQQQGAGEGGGARAWQRGRRIGWSRPARIGPTRPTRRWSGRGAGERIHEGTLEEQYRDAVEASDEREAARLEHREPGGHIGPRNVARAELGVYLERTATARAAEAAEAKYTAMVGTAEKLESTLKKFKGTLAIRPSSRCFSARVGRANS